MCYHPTVDTIAAGLHRDGWSMGDFAVMNSSGWLWVVSGQRDGRWVAVEAATQQEAWRRFTAAARSSFA
jgi:hypothetical protein